MWLLIGVVLFFIGLGLLCAALILDFHGWRNRWIEVIKPDDHLRRSRRVSILGFGWGGLFISVYAILAIGIGSLIRR